MVIFPNFYLIRLDKQLKNKIRNTRRNEIYIKQNKTKSPFFNLRRQKFLKICKGVWSIAISVRLDVMGCSHIITCLNISFFTYAAHDTKKMLKGSCKIRPSKLTRK